MIAEMMVRMMGCLLAASWSKEIKMVCLSADVMAAEKKPARAHPMAESLAEKTADTMGQM